MDSSAAGQKIYLLFTFWRQGRVFLMNLTPMNQEYSKPKDGQNPLAEESLKTEKISDISLKGQEDVLAQSSFSKENSPSLSKPLATGTEAADGKVPIEKERKSPPLATKSSGSYTKTILDRLVDHIVSLLKSMEKWLFTRKEAPQVIIVSPETEEEKEREEKK